MQANFLPKINSVFFSSLAWRGYWDGGGGGRDLSLLPRPTMPLVHGLFLFVVCAVKVQKCEKQELFYLGEVCEDLCLKLKVVTFGVLAVTDRRSLGGSPSSQKIKAQLLQSTHTSHMQLSKFVLPYPCWYERWYCNGSTLDCMLWSRFMAELPSDLPWLHLPAQRFLTGLHIVVVKPWKKKQGTLDENRHK